MKSRIRTHKKRTREQTQEFSTAPAQPMFQLRPFVVQTQQAEQSQQDDLKTALKRAQRYGHHLREPKTVELQAPTGGVVQSQSTEKLQQQPDLKTKLMRAERYGHHLPRIHPAGVPAATAVQQKMAMGKPQQSDRAQAIEVIPSQQLASTPEYKKERKVSELTVQEVGREVESGESGSGRELAKSQYLVVQRARRNSIVDDPNDPQNRINSGQGRGFLQDSTGQTNQAVKFGGLRNDCGTSVEAFIRPNDDMRGSPPGTSRPGWWAAQTTAAGRTDVQNFWVMGHLLNDNVGGPGQKRNLTPITKKANRNHEQLVESFVKGEVLERGNSVDYKVVAQYSGKGPAWLPAEEAKPTSQKRNPAPAAWPNLPTALDCHYKAKNPSGKVVGEIKRTIDNEHA